MYTAGHTAILKMALGELGDLALEKQDMHMLENGLKYPDFPCGAHGISNDGKLVFNRNTCSLLRMLGDINNVLATAFSSHNGYFSTWHSMTYDPRRTVKQITRDVIDQVLSFFILATSSDDEEGYFWLGMALHIVMDSYSPAHVLRRPERGASPRAAKGLNPPATATAAEAADAPSNSSVILKELKDRVNPLAKTIEVADRDAIHEVADEIAEKFNVKSSRSKRQLRELAFFLYYFSHHQFIAKKVYSRLVMQQQQHRKHAAKSYQRRPIVMYHYYPAQSSLAHKLNDRLAAVKRDGLLRLAVQDTARILELYTAYRRSGSRSKREAFIKDAFDHVSRVTFWLARTK